MAVKLVAREVKITPERMLRHRFGADISAESVVDALYMDSAGNKVAGLAGLPYKAPLLQELMKEGAVVRFLQERMESADGLLLRRNAYSEVEVLAWSADDGVSRQTPIPEALGSLIIKIWDQAKEWAGYLNEQGEHVIDLRTPSPGPHFHTNLLMGNRIGYPRALQSTPKSVVDRLGGGSLRSHAATQILATRWDLRQEENGFPANRQFYLVEEGKQIFYSAEPKDSHIESAVCTHSQNYTKIEYKTRCGLAITRLIFLLPQMEGMPLATEVQRITVKNLTAKQRTIRLVYTGMFGSAAPLAQFEDVLYSNIIMQAGVLQDDSGSVMGLFPDYYNDYYRDDIRFHSMLVHGKDGAVLPREFGTSYNEFVGNGSLHHPEGVYQLSNNLFRKGPGFFAVAGELVIEAGACVHADQFTGLVSGKVSGGLKADDFQKEIEGLLAKARVTGFVEEALGRQLAFLERYSGLLKLQSEDSSFNTYVNRILPYQVLYQTFVSRSFCQTQKGYREIGFREIQDTYASMYYFLAMGMDSFVKDMLKEWGAQIYEFGYANHNFYWEGKEPGKWSDDALWFIQAVARYINYTKDYAFLDDACPIAGTTPVRERSIEETIRAVIRYSSLISVGKHGLPLLDLADWNDCLKLDPDCIDGLTKERMYMEQIAAKGLQPGDEPLESEYSESVMNAFLLKFALQEMYSIMEAKGDEAYAGQLARLEAQLEENLQRHTWKDNFFARVLFNREKGPYEYLGAKGDRLSADPAIDGAYFLNSFNWSILSGVATEEQVAVMLDVLDEHLVTPYGIKLMSPADMGKIARFTATGEYYPGDRENGAVFKHASMMATSAMLKAAKTVSSKELAARLSQMAYWMVDLTLPYKTMADPYASCGNPRFCTQYNNSQTGENIGPILSGTSTWLTLTLMSALGIEFVQGGLKLDPLLRDKERLLVYDLQVGEAVYHLEIRKPEGFYRRADSTVRVELDGLEVQQTVIPLSRDKGQHTITMQFE